MVKDSSKKLIKEKAEKVKEVIVKKVIEPEIVTPEPTIQEKPKVSKMPKEISKPKKVKKVSKFIQTGKEDKANFISDEAEKVATGQSMGIYAGIAIGVLLASIGGYYVYQKLFKNRNKKKDVETIETKDIKSLTEVKKVDKE